MAKEMERDLGLYAVVTISMGAMIGSGIFVLPGLAAKIAGPAVILAYLLAAVLVLPAALSKSEMATAMPESGGTYLYIDRGMGPLMGTIAGIGTWFSLVFKSSFALVGLGSYLLLFAPLPKEPVALGLAAILIAVNILGVKQTGRFQAFIVSGVVAVMAGFVAFGAVNVDQARFTPFFAQGMDGLLAAAGFVFVSYAGVTKIASIAEEVEDPGRTIPLGILASMGIMMVLYTLIVFVIIGVTPIASIAESLTPMAVAGRAFLGPAGATVVAITAVLALTSMANAGLLSSSRYPLAMSRDSLAPDRFSTVSDRFGTPIAAITLTGLVMMLLIAFVPVIRLAKLASAFQILVFSLANLALIVFRESDLDWYEPSFQAPLYPWLQLFGIAGGVVLLTQMGLVPMAGAAGIIVLSLLWFKLYGREKVEREGAAVDTLRRTAKQTAAERAREELADDTHTVLLPLERSLTREQEERLIRMAADIAASKDGEVHVIRFREVPEQTALPAATGQTAEDVEFEELTGELADDVGVPVRIGEVVSHRTRRAIVNYADHAGIDLILATWEPGFLQRELPGSELNWLMEHAPCDLVFAQERGYDLETVTVVAERTTFDALQLRLAEAIASRHDARLELLYLVEEDATEQKIDAAETYLAETQELFSVEVDTRVVETEGSAEAILSCCEGTDLILGRETSHHLVRDVIFGHLPDAIAERADATVLLTYSNKPRRHTFLRRVLERVLF